MMAGSTPPSRVSRDVMVEKILSDEYALEHFSLVYAKEDEHIAQSLMGELRKNVEALLDIAPEGFVLFICTKNSIDNNRIIEELEQAKTNDATIITFVFNVTIPSSILSLLQSDRKPNGKQIYEIPAVPKSEDFHLLVDLIEGALSRKIVGSIECQARAYNAMARLQEELNYNDNFHSEEAVLVGRGGAIDDYIEYYSFPCCGRTVKVGDGPISRFRADGCCKKETGAE